MNIFANRLPALAWTLGGICVLGCHPDPPTTPATRAPAAHPPQPPAGRAHSPGGNPESEKRAHPAPPPDAKTGASVAPGSSLFQKRNEKRATPCAALQCYLFASPALALRALLSDHAPRVVSFGEAHAPAHYTGKSTVARFTDELLPVLAPQASTLTVELLAPPAKGCAEEKQVAQKKSDEITSGQKQENQNEYLALGHAAREARVAPDILHASCDDLEQIASPEGGVLAYMETIARLFADELSHLSKLAPEARPLTVSYGGALHNDALPRAERASWSFAPTVLEATRGRYLEVDLIVPALISESGTWKSFAWYSAYEDLKRSKSAPVDATVVIPWGEHSAALIFPSEPGPP